MGKDDWVFDVHGWCYDLLPHRIFHLTFNCSEAKKIRGRILIGIFVVYDGFCGTPRTGGTLQAHLFYPTTAVYFIVFWQFGLHSLFCYWSAFISGHVDCRCGSGRGSAFLLYGVLSRGSDNTKVYG